MADDKNILVAYFSASGETARLARTIAQATGGELFEIEPEEPYTAADLDWNDKRSRSSVEMNDPASRPAVASRVANMDAYDTVFVGFPIWWYTAPNIIRSFLESYDFNGKTIILFATSGGSGLGKTAEELSSCCPGAVVKDGRLMNENLQRDTLKHWAGAFM